MSFSRLIWLNLVILAASSLHVDAVFAQIFNGVRQHPVAGHVGQGQKYFTIMGHVARPNSYELPTSSPSLVSFIQYAGNLTAPASGQIRIIRDGRVAQSTYYSENSTLRLAPGDIVVVDGKANQGRVILPSTKGSVDPDSDVVKLALTGLREYPVVLNVPSENATIRWVTRHVGLDQSNVNSVRAVTARSFDRVTPDTRLSTGTVLAFDRKLVDPSRLSENLPGPVKAGKPSTQLTQRPVSVGRSTQRLVAGDAAIQHNSRYSATPGRAIIPSIGPRTLTAGSFPNGTSLPDHASIQLDEQPTGRAFVPKPDAEIDPPDDTAATTLGESGKARISDQIERTETERNDRVQVPSIEAGTSDITVVTPPEAPRPYQSTPENPELLQPFSISRVPVNDEAGSLPSDAYDPPTATDANDTPDAADSAASKPFSFAAQSAEVTAPGALPGPVRGSTQASPSTSQAGNVLTLARPQSSTQSTTATNDEPGPPQLNQKVPESSRSQLLPPPPSGDLNVPVVTVVTVGFLGAIAASFLIYSIVRENPAPRVVEVDTSGRYWLDRMIENDIPVVDELVQYPHNTQLFGKPNPIQRIDAAHTSVPRPHFSAPGGKSGVLKANPAAPDAPSPDTPDEHQGRIVRTHSGRPAQQQAARAVPEPHSLKPAAKPLYERYEETGSIETVVFGDASNSVKSDQSNQQASEKRVRSFRVDTGHKTKDAIAQTKTYDATDQDSASAGDSNLLKRDASSQNRARSTRQTVAVQPSPVVVEGNNLLDRILSTVDSERHTTRRSDESSEV